MLRKHRQRDGLVPRPSLRCVSLTKPDWREVRHLRGGEVQREVNIYHNGPGPQIRRKVTVVLSHKMPWSKSMYAAASCCCLFISLHEQRSELQSIIWQLNRFVADKQKWFLHGSSAAKENSLLKIQLAFQIKAVVSRFLMRWR